MSVTLKEADRIEGCRGWHFNRLPGNWRREENQLRVSAWPSETKGRAARPDPKIPSARTKVMRGSSRQAFSVIEISFLTGLVDLIGAADFQPYETLARLLEKRGRYAGCSFNDTSRSLNRLRTGEEAISNHGGDQVPRWHSATLPSADDVLFCGYGHTTGEDTSLVIA